MDIENTEVEVDGASVDETAEVVKTEKTFTQADIDKAVRERLAREKTTQKAMSEGWTAKETEYQSQLAAYETIIKATVETRMANVPEPVKKLLSKLSILEQWEYLTDESNFQTDNRPHIPSTPQGGGKVNTPEQLIQNKRSTTDYSL